MRTPYLLWSMLGGCATLAACTTTNGADDGAGDTGTASTGSDDADTDTSTAGDTSPATTMGGDGDPGTGGDGDPGTGGDGDPGTGGDGDGNGDGDGPCGWGDAVPGATVTRDIEVGGITRTFALQLPGDYDCSPRPLVLGLHGYYGSGAGFQSSTSSMDGRLDALGYIGIFPDGLPMSRTGWKSAVTSFNDVDSHQSDGPDGPTCTVSAYDYDVYDNCPPEESEDLCNWGTSCADDEAFFRALIEAAVNEWSADPARVLMTGFSQGGQTTQSMAWRMSDVLTVASPHHGFAANGHTQSPSSKLSLFQVWASDDTVVNGNEVPSSDGMIYDGAQETLSIWADGQGCDASPSPYPTPFDGLSGWDCVQHDNCSTGAEVVSCVWQGGHVWGKTPQENFALESMLSFFADQTP